MITNSVDEAILLSADRIIPLSRGPKATFGPSIPIPHDVQMRTMFARAGGGLPGSLTLLTSRRIREVTAVAAAGAIPQEVEPYFAHSRLRDSASGL